MRNLCYAQFVAAGLTDQFVSSVTTTSGGVADPWRDDVAVNCDMLRHGVVGEPIKAIVWDEGAESQNGFVYFEDYSGNNVTLGLNGWRPDVVLGDDPDNPGVDYRAAVVYIDSITLTPAVNFYSLTNFGLPSFTATLTSTAPLSSTPVSTPLHNFEAMPHIDMWSNANNIIYGYPAMEEFAVTWMEGGNVYCNWGNIATGSLYEPLGSATSQVTGSFNNHNSSDVACFTDVNTGIRYAAFSHLDWSAGLLITEVDFTTNPTPSPFPPFPLNVWGNAPRIEAMSQYDLTVGAAKWNVVVSFVTSGYSFSDLVPGGTDITTALSGGGNFTSTAVAAGIGRHPGGGFPNIGDQQYTAGFYEWHSSMGATTPPPAYYAREIDITGSVFNPAYYEINTNPIPGMPEHHIADASSGLALSNCSNSGQYIMSAWYDGADAIGAGGTFTGVGGIWYKLTTSSPMFFKPTNLSNSIHSRSTVLYPNPATDKIYLKEVEGDYIIYNLTGIKVAEGKLLSGEHIPVGQLANGIYLLKTAQNKTYSFTKE